MNTRKLLIVLLEVLFVIVLVGGVAFIVFLFNSDRLQVKEISPKISSFCNTVIYDGNLYSTNSDIFYCFDGSSGKVKWDFKTDGTIFNKPIFSNDKIILGPDNTKLYCLNAMTGVKLWQQEVAGSTSAYSSILSDGKVYVGLKEGMVSCFDVDTGKKIWEQNVDDACCDAKNAPIILDNKLFFNSKNFFLCFDSKTGEKKWEQKVFGDCCFNHRSHALSNGKVYLISNNFDEFKGIILCLDFNTGKKLWGKQFDDTPLDLPIVFDGRMYVTSGSYGLLSLNADNGSNLWDHETSTFPDYMMLQNDRIYVYSNFDKEIQCFNASIGIKLWGYMKNDSYDSTFSSSEYYQYKPLNLSGDGNKVYVVISKDLTDEILCLDAQNGKLLWNRNVFISHYSPFISDGMVFAGSEGGFRCLNDATGEVLWEHIGSEESFQNPVVSSGKLYISSSNGTFLCFDSKTGVKVWEFKR